MNELGMIQEGFIVISLVILLSALFGTFYNYFTAPRLESSPTLNVFPHVSLLIPARNEAENLRILLPMLSKIEYPNLEILILNDNSQDASEDVVRFSGCPVEIIKGKVLPKDWLGKNWACAQLAEEAQGEIFIFCDADVRVGPKAVLSTVSMIQQMKLDALTGLPRQILGTWVEKAVLPILLFQPLFSFLPIAMISKLPLPILSVGCGQWFAFTREAYQKLGGHAIVRNVIVEDMTLGRLIKKNGMILGATLTQNHLQVRMYTDFKSLWEGFGKNLNFLTGSGFIRPPLIFSGFFLYNILPWIIAFTNHPLHLLPISLWLISRGVTAIVFRETFWGWLWSPLGILLIPIMAFRSWWGFRKKTLQWKGRILSAAFEGDRGVL